MRVTRTNFKEEIWLTYRIEPKQTHASSDCLMNTKHKACGLRVAISLWRHPLLEHSESLHWTKFSPDIKGLCLAEIRAKISLVQRTAQARYNVFLLAFFILLYDFNIFGKTIKKHSSLFTLWLIFLILAPFLSLFPKQYRCRCKNVQIARRGIIFTISWGSICMAAVKIVIRQITYFTVFKF